jgi:hypothetical protein
MTTITAKPHRLDPHNASVSFAADAAGYCGFLLLAAAYIWLIRQRGQLSISRSLPHHVPDVVLHLVATDEPGYRNRRTSFE